MSVEKPRNLRWTMSGEEMVRSGELDELLSSKRDVRSLGRDDLDVVFQPIVRLADGSTFAWEALARCDVPGFREPARLFESASRARFCGRLGRMLRETTFARCMGRRIFVNAHPDELQARWIVRPDDPLGLHDAQVYLEITEAAAFDYFDVVAAALGELNGRGVRTVIDDFGAGYSNLGRIADLNPAIVKLDRSLIQGLHESRGRQQLVSAVVRLCVTIGAEVVAEGIETVDELSAVIDSGAHYGQGFLLARPAYPFPKVEWPCADDGEVEVLEDDILDEMLLEDERSVVGA